MSADLFNLMPAVYRIRDIAIAESQQLLTAAELTELATLQGTPPPLSLDDQLRLDELTAKAQRGPLHSLLLVLQEQLEVLAEDLDQLYDDQFIETCARWVIPYIGDLIGYQSVKGIAPAVDDPRVEVAETISQRRRKGTVLVMEQLARDMTAWGAHAVEMFQVLGDTQYMNHLRLWSHYAPDLRDWKSGLYMETGFDRTAHKVDVRRIAARRGRYNLPNIGIFLWSLGAYSITGDQAAISAASPECLRFSSLGMDIPLFHRAISQGEEITDPAHPYNVADRLKRRVLCDDLRKGVGATYYGEGKSLALYLDGKLLNPYEIEVANLSGAEGSWANVPASGSPFRAAIDPELGRIALPPAAIGKAPPAVTVSYHYGFNADVGGGEYARSDSFLVDDDAFVFPFPDPVHYPDLQSAINFAIGKLTLNGAVAVEIDSSQTYPQGGSLVLKIDVPAGCTVELRAADGKRPTLLLDSEISITGDVSSTCALNGLLLAAAADMVPASPTPVALVHAAALRPDGSSSQLEALNVTHCTLVPGWSVASDGTPRFPTEPGLVAEPAGLTVTATTVDPGSDPGRRVRQLRGIRQHHRRHRSGQCGDCRAGRRRRSWVTDVGKRAERRSQPDSVGLHCGGQDSCGAAEPGFEQHLLGRTCGRRYVGDWAHQRPQAGRLRALQLPAGKGQDAAPLRVRGAGYCRSATYLLRAALRAAGLHEAADVHG